MVVIYIAHKQLQFILLYIAVIYIAHTHLYFILPMYSCTLYCPYAPALYIAQVQLYFILPITEFSQKTKILEQITFSEDVLHGLKSKRQADVSNLLSGHIS
jgi:hypothetical protein